jgi:hypothetical protein
MAEETEKPKEEPKKEDKGEKKEQPQNLTVVLDTKSGKVKKTISLKTPSGETYTGEVSGEAE